MIEEEETVEDSMEEIKSSLKNSQRLLREGRLMRERE